MKVLKTALLFLMCVSFSFSCKEGVKEVRVLKLAHGLPPSHSVHLGLLYMNERLKELSGGKMSMDIYSSAQLGSENQCIELLQIGSLDITKVSSGEQFFEVLDGSVGKQILGSTEPYWFRGLAYFDSGARSFYTVNKQIRTPEDLKGLKIRVQKSPIAVEMMKTFGGSATPVDWGELYTALQSNVVDGAENNTPSVTTAFHHEVVKYYSVNEHTMCPDVIIISLATWQKPTEQERNWLRQAADAAAIYQRKLWAEQEKQSLEEMEAHGVEIIYPDKQPFMDAAAPMIERFKNDPVFHDLIDQIQNTHEKDN